MINEQSYKIRATLSWTALNGHSLHLKIGIGVLKQLISILQLLIYII